MGAALLFVNKKAESFDPNATVKDLLNCGNGSTISVGGKNLHAIYGNIDNRWHQKRLCDIEELTNETCVTINGGGLRGGSGAPPSQVVPDQVLAPPPQEVSKTKPTHHTVETIKEAVPPVASLQRRPSSGDEVRPLVATDVERGGIVTVADIDAEGCWLPASKNTADETLPKGVTQLDRESPRNDAQDSSHARKFVSEGVEHWKEQLEEKWKVKLGFCALSIKR